MHMNSIYEKVYEEVSKLTIIDTHEHLPENEKARSQNTDFFREYLIHYFNRDLISGGFKPEMFGVLYDDSKSMEEKFLHVEKYWNQCKFTGYGQVLDIAVKGLYGIDGINVNTVGEIDFRIKESLSKEHFKYVLQEKSKIEKGVLCRAEAMDCDREFFAPTLSFDHFICFDRMQVLINLENFCGFKITDFKSYLDACEKYILAQLDTDAVAVKCGLAYRRSLFFDQVPYNVAELEFISSLKRDYSIDKGMRTMQFSKEFEDFMMHYILKILNSKGVVLQIHTGLHEGNGNMISNSNPELLNNLFLLYDNIKFDIFHIGYPYEHILSALSKNFPNVYIDMCWAHAISPVACINSLSEWLEALPYSKILAFGGDYIFVDGVYGHQELARRNVSKTLAMKIEDGLFGIDEARIIAKAIFYDNPKKLYNI